MQPSSGGREHKRQATQERIIAAGLRLFLADGYEQTTLDAVAAEAGISRRTFFSYFKSKDDLIFAWQDNSWQTVLQELLAASPDLSPLEAVHNVMLRHIARHTTDQMIAIDRLMRSSQTLLDRKPAVYIQREQDLFETLCQVWRQPQRRERLRVVAMVSIGAARIAIDAWHAGDHKKPIAATLTRVFADLRAELRE